MSPQSRKLQDEARGLEGYGNHIRHVVAAAASCAPLGGGIDVTGRVVLVTRVDANYCKPSRVGRARDAAARTGESTPLHGAGT